jgi:nucleoside-diphosphate-sugar epimerase
MLNGARMANRSRVLVTGSAGFISRAVVSALLAEGHEVTVADLRAFPRTSVRWPGLDPMNPAVGAGVPA